MDWNLADLYELVADTAPDRVALAHGTSGSTRTWRELDRCANALALHLARGHKASDKLAIYSYNRPEFVEALVGALKARLVPVNVNYRYREEELVYLFDNSDSTAVVYESEFADRVARVRARLPKVRDWIEITGGAPLANPFALRWEDIVGTGTDERLDIQRDPADRIFMYTGGTTGMPKGVMWEQKALYNSLGAGGNPLLGEEPSRSVNTYSQQARRLARMRGQHPVGA